MMLEDVFCLVGFDLIIDLHRNVFRVFDSYQLQSFCPRLYQLARRAPILIGPDEVLGPNPEISSSQSILDILLVLEWVTHYW